MDGTRESVVQACVCVNRWAEGNARIREIEK